VAAIAATMSSVYYYLMLRGNPSLEITREQSRRSVVVVGEQCLYRASASRSALRFSVAVSKCFLVSLITTGSASLKKPRLSPL